MKPAGHLRLLAYFAAVIFLTAPGEALAQQGPPKFPCGAGFVQQAPLLYKAGLQLADANAQQVGLTFVGHATFDIRSPRGIRVVTDYNDNFRQQSPPDIATMNIDRGNHSSYAVEPSVKHTLRGWDTGTGIPRHDVRLGDVRVYNVPTNIFDNGGTPTNDSSMFVIQTGGLCIAHMGHIRHALDQERVRQLGRIDILLLPVDRRVTQSMDELLHNVSEIKPRVIIPMHYFSFGLAQEFAKSLGNQYPVRQIDGTRVDVTRASLPVDTQVWLMKPVAGFFQGGGDF